MKGMTGRTGNLWTAALAVLTCAVLAILLGLLSANRAGDVVLSRPSTFFTDPSGARGLYLILEQVLPDVEIGQWRRSLMLLAEAESPSTLVVMGPMMDLGRGEADALDAWIRSGGQLILATSEPWDVASRSEEGEDYAARHGLAHPEDLPEGGALSSVQTAGVGLGRILYVADAHAFSNASLEEGNSAVWLVQRVSEWGGSVFFDEYHLGFGVRRSLTSLIGVFLVTPWGLAGLQLGLAAAVFLLGYKKRFGRPVDPLPVERTSRIETIDALSGLFRAADARPLAVKAIDQYLTTSLTGELGQRVDLADARVRKRLADRTAENLTSYASAVEGVLGGRVPEDAELIEIGRQAAAIGRSLRYGRSGDDRPSPAG